MANARLDRFRRSRAFATSLSAVAVAGGLALVPFAGCAEPENSLVIIQNQKPEPDETANGCIVPTDLSKTTLQGVYDVDLDQPYPYFVYPLIESRFPSVRAGGSGGIERNSVLLTAVRVEIAAPLDPGWPAGCPGKFDSPIAAVIDPGQTRSVAATGFQPCHAARLRELIKMGKLSGDATQPVFFHLQLQAVGTRQGEQIGSDKLPFPVQVCAGCLQRQYPDTPTCQTAPKPNPDKGNACNIAQDFGWVLCCADMTGKLICPAPDV